MDKDLNYLLKSLLDNEVEFILIGKSCAITAGHSVPPFKVC